MSKSTPVVVQTSKDEVPPSSASPPTQQDPQPSSPSVNMNETQGRRRSSHSDDMNIGEEEWNSPPVTSYGPSIRNMGNGTNPMNISRLTTSLENGNRFPSVINSSIGFMHTRGNQRSSSQGAVGRSASGPSTGTIDLQSSQESNPTPRQSKIRKLNNSQAHRVVEHEQGPTDVGSPDRNLGRAPHTPRLRAQRGPPMTSATGNISGDQGPSVAQPVISPTISHRPFVRRQNRTRVVRFQDVVEAHQPSQARMSRSPPQDAGATGAGQGSNHANERGDTTGFAIPLILPPGAVLVPPQSFTRHQQGTQNRRTSESRVPMQDLAPGVHERRHSPVATPGATPEATLPERLSINEDDVVTFTHATPAVRAIFERALWGPAGPPEERLARVSTGAANLTTATTTGTRREELPALHPRSYERLEQQDVWVMRWNLLVADSELAEVTERAERNLRGDSVERVTARNTRINSSLHRRSRHQNGNAANSPGLTFDEARMDHGSRRNENGNAIGRDTGPRRPQPFARPSPRFASPSPRLGFESFPRFPSQLRVHEPSGGNRSGHAASGGPSRNDVANTGTQRINMQASSAGSSRSEWRRTEPPTYSNSSICPQYDETRPSETVNNQARDDIRDYRNRNYGRVPMRDGEPRSSEAANHQGPAPSSTQSRNDTMEESSARTTPLNPHPHSRHRMLRNWARRTGVVRMRSAGMVSLPPGHVVELTNVGPVTTFIRHAIESDENVRSEVAEILGVAPQDLNEGVLQGLNGANIGRILSLLHVGNRRRRYAAPKSVIDAIPTEIATAADLEITCVICLCEVEVGETLKKLPCNHKYHAGCIDQWLSHNGCCPMDKRRVCELQPSLFNM